MKYKYLLIDNDNTIMDFSASEYDCIGKTLCAFSLPDDDDTRKTYAKINDGVWKDFERGVIKREEIPHLRFGGLLKHLKIDANEEIIDQFAKRYESELANSAILFDGAIDFLRTIRKYMKVYIVTNGLKHIQRKRFSDSNIEKEVDGIIISAQIGFQKPQKEFFDYTLSFAGIENAKDAIVVGDSLSSDIAGGLAAGIDTCLFDLKCKYTTDDIKPKYIVHSYQELLELLI